MATIKTVLSFRPIPGINCVNVMDIISWVACIGGFAAMNGGC